MPPPIRGGGIITVKINVCGSVAESSAAGHGDQQDAGSNPGRRVTKCNRGQVVYTYQAV